ncbi:hypothetical protein [Sphingomonas sp.]|uniref:hypothetical protein n=1 Tax=Sphingomonas sp. TaxID=28214 RepID=UPI00286CB837|nr:hypothetical protein [Sphingomonas sp.]
MPGETIKRRLSGVARQGVDVDVPFGTFAKWLVYQAAAKSVRVGEFFVPLPRLGTRSVARGLLLLSNAAAKV